MLLRVNFVSCLDGILFTNYKSVLYE